LLGWLAIPTTTAAVTRAVEDFEEVDSPIPSMSDALGSGITTSHIGHLLYGAECTVMSRLNIEAPVPLRDSGGELIFTTWRLFVRFIVRKATCHPLPPRGRHNNVQHALANKAKKGLLDAIRSILMGRRTTAKTLNKFCWSLTHVNRIRALDARFKAVLEGTHNVNLDNVFKGAALSPLNALAADV